MTKRTHQIAGITAVSYMVLSSSVSSMTVETLIGVSIAAMVGAILPDIDNVASPAWKHGIFPWEGEATRDFLQGHRHISHSIIGFLLFSALFVLLMRSISFPRIDASIVEKAFMYSQLSHLVMDSLTIQGVPWLYPIRFNFGFPPFAFLRVKTGGFLESAFVFPLLVALLVWIYYVYRHTFLLLVQNMGS